MLNNFNKLAIVGNKFIYLLDIIVLCLWVPKKIQNNPSNVGMAGAQGGHGLLMHTELRLACRHGKRIGWAWQAHRVGMVGA